MRTTLAASVLAIAVTACVDVNMDFVMRDDGSGSAAVSMRVNEAGLELAMLGEGADPELYCHLLADQPVAGDPMGFGLDGADSSTEAVFDGDECVVTSTVTWTAEESDTVLDALRADGGPSFRQLDDGGWRFDLETASLSEDLTDDDLSQAAALGFDLPTLTLSVTLPGDAVEHNADAVRSFTYTWEFDTAEMREFPGEIYVETAPGGGGLGPAAIGGIIAAIVLALAALVTLRKHQEAKAAAASEPAGDSAAADAEDAGGGSDEAAQPDDPMSSS